METLEALEAGSGCLHGGPARPTVISDILHQREEEGERPPLLLDREERAYLRAWKTARARRRE